MRRRFACYLDGSLALAFFGGVCLTRALAANAFVTWDEPAWVYRSAKFLLALSRGDLGATPVVGHPGVLTMWCGAAGLAIYRLLNGATAAAQLAAVDGLASLQVHDQATLRLLDALLPAAKSLLPLAHGAILVVLYLLLRRLLGRRPAIVTCLFLACDPFYLALSRVLHTDALASGMMVVALTGGLLYLQAGKRRYLLLAGVAGGLGAVTKMYALGVAPALLFLLLALHLRRPRVAGWPLRLLRDGSLCAVIAVVAFAAIWPAMWAAPLRTLRALFDLSCAYATNPGDATATLFLGQGSAADAAFYPVAALFRSTPLVLGGVLLALVSIWWLREDKDAPRRTVTVAALAYSLLYMALMTISPKKYDRYILPALLALDLAAALGWLGFLEFVLHRWRRIPRQCRVPLAVGVLVALIGVQTLLLLASLFPAHSLAYYNPLLGGARQAAQAMPIGWGEGVEQAAAYLAAQPEASELTVATLAVAGVAPYFPGQVVPLDLQTVPAADYILLYVGDVQQPTPLVERLRQGEPEYVVWLNGIEYAWLYRNDCCEEVEAVLARVAGQGDVAIANVHSAGERYLQDLVSWQTVDGATEDAIALQLQRVAGNSKHIFYVEFDGQPRLPGEWIRRQLAQAALLLWEEPFAYGTLSCYLKPAENHFHVTQAVLPAGVDLGPLRLACYGLWADSVQYRQQVGVALEWQLTQSPAQDLRYSLRLVDAEGHWWAQQDGVLENTDLQSTSSWPAASVQHSYQTLALPPGIPPGYYWVQFCIYSPQDQVALPVTASNGQKLGDQYRLGMLQVNSASVPPAVEELEIPHRTDVQPGEAIELLGYALSADTFPSGDEVTVTLWWRCLRAMSERYELALRLERDGQSVAEQRLALAGAYPTDQWQEGEILCYPQRLTIPPEAASGDYRLLLNLYGGDGRPLAATDIFLAAVHVEHRERLYSAPPIRFPLQVGLGGQIQFLGYDLAETAVASGEVLHLTLYWQATAQPDQDYTVFTHLLDAQGIIHGQRDSVPLSGERPTTSWTPGEFLVDTYEIPVDAEAPPGTYQIEIGLYDPLTGARLPLTRNGQPTGEDRVLLPTILAVYS